MQDPKDKTDTVSISSERDVLEPIMKKYQQPEDNTPTVKAKSPAVSYAGAASKAPGSSNPFQGFSFGANPEASKAPVEKKEESPMNKVQMQFQAFSFGAATRSESPATVKRTVASPHTRADSSGSDEIETAPNSEERPKGDDSPQTLGKSPILKPLPKEPTLQEELVKLLLPSTPSVRCGG